MARHLIYTGIACRSALNHCIHLFTWPVQYLCTLSHVDIICILHIYTQIHACMCHVRYSTHVTYKLHVCIPYAYYIHIECVWHVGHMLHVMRMLPACNSLVCCLVFHFNINVAAHVYLSHYMLMFTISFKISIWCDLMSTFANDRGINLRYWQYYLYW